MRPPVTAPPPTPRSPTGSASCPRHSRRAPGTAGSWERSQHFRDRWSPELGPEDLASSLEVTGYPKTSLCGVSEMVAEGEGTGSSWFLLSKFRQNGVAKSLTDTVTHRSPGKRQWGRDWVSLDWTPTAEVGVGKQTRGKSQGLLRLRASVPFNPRHPVNALPSSRGKTGKKRAQTQDARVGLSGEGEVGDRVRVNKVFSRPRTVLESHTGNLGTSHLRVGIGLCQGQIGKKA